MNLFSLTLPVTDLRSPKSRLARVHLANFQAIRSFTTLDIAPLTLLFGPNSAGKSAIRDALDLIRELTSASPVPTRVRGMCDRWTHRIGADRTARQPTSIVVGFGVTGFVGDQLDRDYFAHRGFGSSYADLPFCGMAPRDAKVVDFLFRVDGAMRQYAIYADGSLYFGRDWIANEIRFVFGHSHAGRTAGEVEKLLKGGIAEKFLKEEGSQLVLSGLRDAHIPPPETLALSYNQDMFDVSEFLGTELDARDLALVLDYLTFGLPLEYAACAEARSLGSVRFTPAPGDLVFEFEPRAPGYWWRVRERRDEDRGLEEWRLLAFDLTSEIAGGQPTYAPSADGTSARSVLDRVNQWLSDPALLDCGFSVHGEIKLVMPVSHWLTAHNAGPAAAKEFFAETTKRVELRLVKSSLGAIDIADVGAGLSQMVPILVATYANHTVFIEQPELHLHPRLQTRLADVFIERMNDLARACSLMVETHSEHLLLRILRRIRETRAGRVGDASRALAPDDVAVLYLDPSPDGTRVLRLKISEDGDFLDRWPQGFFEERAGELFDE